MWLNFIIRPILYLFTIQLETEENEETIKVIGRDKLCRQNSLFQNKGERILKRFQASQYI